MQMFFDKTPYKSDETFVIFCNQVQDEGSMSNRTPYAIVQFPPAKSQFPGRGTQRQTALGGLVRGSATPIPSPVASRSRRTTKQITQESVFPAGRRARGGYRGAPACPTGRDNITRGRPGAIAPRVQFPDAPRRRNTTTRRGGQKPLRLGICRVARDGGDKSDGGGEPGGFFARGHPSALDLRRSVSTCLSGGYGTFPVEWTLL